jgi:6-phospho-beta-glucosidase
MGIKLVVIGGASSYTPELFANLASDPGAFDVERVTLVDLNAEKLAFMSQVCQKQIHLHRLSMELVTTTNMDEGLQDADFVLPQIRVGGLEARVRDETLPMQLGMVGNETTGAGGFVCAMRVLPVMLEIAQKIEIIAPQAWILNLTNPAGIVTEAISKQTKVKTLGFCNIPTNTTYALADVLGVDPSTLQLDSFGLNHLSWSRRAIVDGVDRLQPLLDQATDRNSILYDRGLVEPHLDPLYLQTIRMIPSWYVRFFYYPELILQEDLISKRTKGMRDMEAENELRTIFTNDGYDDRARQILSNKGGAQYYLPVLRAIDSIVHDRGDVVTVDTMNQTALPDLPADVCVEVPAKIYRERIVPLEVGPMPVAVRGLVQAVKAYEELTIEAAVTNSQKTAIAALMANPLVGTYPKASVFLDKVITNEGKYFKFLR